MNGIKLPWWFMPYLRVIFWLGVMHIIKPHTAVKLMLYASSMVYSRRKRRLKWLKWIYGKR